MEALRELEARLDIKPLNFDRLRDNPKPIELTEIKEQPVAKVTKIDKREQAKELITKYKDVIINDFDEYDFLNSEKIDFTALSNKWRVLKNNIINIYDKIKNLYKTSENEEVKNQCKVILIGMLHKDLTKKEMNDLITNLNGMV